MIVRLASAAFLLLPLLAVTGCGDSPTSQQNPYLTFTDTFGISSEIGEDDVDAAKGAAADEIFRLPITLTMTNNHPTADLETSFVAWVEIGNVRNMEQEDALLRDGYIQLDQEVRLGSAFVLPVGTYVYDGGGLAGTTGVHLGQAGGAGVPSSQTFGLITPDALVMYGQPPVSCDSVAFVFTRDGEPLTSVTGGAGLFEGATGSGGVKTLAQVNVYQCSPLRPGLFLRSGGIIEEENEFLEGADILIEFNEFPTVEGADFAIVTIS